MSWLQSFIVAILAVATMFYVARAVAVRRAGNPNWSRWALLAGLFALARVLTSIAPVASA